MYCGTRRTPCESWPRRFASTRLRATIAASSLGTPAASKRDRERSISVSAKKVGMGRLGRRGQTGFTTETQRAQRSKGGEELLTGSTGWTGFQIHPVHPVDPVQMSSLLSVL